MIRPLNWSPSSEDKQRLLDFEGYGPDAPEVIFVGLEEYCHSESERQRDAIFTRCTHPAFAGKRADKNLATQALTGQVTTDNVRAWQVMASIVSALTGGRQVEEYDALGSRPPRSSPSTWLTELRPLPMHNTNAYRGTYIEDWFHFRDRADYERQSELLSVRRIREALSVSAPPQFAFFYGKPTCQWAHRHLADHLVAPFEHANDNIEIGQTALGTRIVLTGFYKGQHKRSAFELHHIPALIRRLL